MSKKRICFVATLPISLKTFVYAQAELLVCNGWDVTWICGNDPEFYKELPKGVKYIPLPFRRGIYPFDAPKMIYALYKIFRREYFDIVQFSTLNATLYASTASWLAHIHIRIYAQWGIRYVGFKGIQRHIFKLIEYWCCSCSTIIEPDSLSNYKFSIDEKIYSENKGRVIWNGSACGVNLERFDINHKEIWRNEYRELISIKSQDLVIGFVGSIRSDKGCNELISACRSFFCDMPTVRLLLVGDKKFYNTIDKGLRDWVTSSSQVIQIPPNDKIPQYMACMDVFSLPSYREGFGMAIVEAEAMGIPVVVSDIPGPIDAMQHKYTGLVVPVKNVKALALALQTLLKDEIKRNAFGTAASQYAKEKFDQREFLRYVLADKEGLFKTNIKATQQKMS